MTRATDGSRPLPHRERQFRDLVAALRTGFAARIPTVHDDNRFPALPCLWSVYRIGERSTAGGPGHGRGELYCTIGPPTRPVSGCEQSENSLPLEVYAIGILPATPDKSAAAKWF